MPLHIIKLSVGSEDIDDMYRWLKDSKAGRDKFSHTTRMFPRRKDEILPGGSLYWVIRGVILCRTPIADLVPLFRKDYTAIVMDSDQFLGVATRLDLINYFRITA